MALVSTVTAVITAKTAQFQKQMAAAQTSLGKFSQKAATVGPALTKGVTLPMAAIAGVSLKAASDFEASMTKIETLVGRTAEEVEMLQEEVLGLSGSTARAPKELADAMFFITSAGLPAAEAVETLEYAAKAAAIGLGKTESVADAVTNAINGYGKENISASLATDILAKTVEQGKASAESLAPTFGKLIPMAAELGIEFDQVGGGLAYMTRSSGDAAMSATQLGQVMRTVLKPSQQANEVLQNIGYSSEQLRADVEDDLLGALVGLREKLEGSGYEMSNVFENARALIGALSLTARGGEDAAEVFAAMEDSAGKVDTAFARVQETSQFKLQQSMASLKTALVDVGNVLIPILVPVLKTMADIIGAIAKAFAGLDGPIKKVTLAFLGLAAAAGPLTTMGGKVAAGFASMGPAATRAGAAVGPKKGFGFVLGKTLGIMKKHPVAAAGVIAGGLLINKMFSGMRKRAQEARDRMSTLREEFIAAGDPTVMMVDKVKELAAALKSAEDAAEDTSGVVSDFVGEGTLMAELIKKDAVDGFVDLGLEMGLVTEVMSTGTDRFQELKEASQKYGVTQEDVIALLRKEEGAIGKVTNALADNIQEGKMSVAQAADILYSLDETADAFDDNAKDVEKNAKAYLTSKEGIADVTGVLGTYGASLIAAADENDNYGETLDEINGLMEDVDTAINGNIGAWLGYGQVAEETVEVSEEVIQTQEEIEAALAAAEEQAQELRNAFDRLVEGMYDSIDAAYDFDLAQLELAEAMLGVRDALDDTGKEEMTALERERELINASKEWAEGLADLGDSMTEMPVEDLNRLFGEQGQFLEEMKDKLPEEEYNRLLDLFNKTYDSALKLHGQEIMVKYGITGNIDPSMNRWLDMLDQAGSMEKFGAQVSTFLGGATQMASGGIITAPTLGLVGEAGPEAVIPLDRLGTLGGGGSTNVTVNVQGSVLAEYDLAETIQNQLVRIKGRNASLEFG